MQIQQIENSDQPVDVKNSRRRGLFRLWLTFGIVVAVIAGGVALAVMPVPYVIQSPGPTINVLGKQGDTDILEFSEPEDDSIPSAREGGDDEGQLRMVTVSEIGGPGSTVRGIDWLRAQFLDGYLVRPYSELYDETVTAEQIQESAAAQMTSSHSTSAIAAMEYLGIPIDSTLTVAGVAPGSDSEGKFEDGDVLVALELPNGDVHPVDTPSVPFVVLKTVAPNSTVNVVVDRSGQIVTIPVVTGAPGDGSEGSKLGIYLSAETEMPIEVNFHLERIGGPSAGLIFALGIVDQLSPESITGGQVIAGTGAMSFAGDVLPIGGVVQKMYGAVRDGAKWFLVPTSNCDSVVGNEPDGLRVIPVSTLAEGVAAVEAIASGEGDELPVCEAN